MTEKMSEQWQRMISGQTYTPFDADIKAQKERIRQLVAQFNRSPSRGNLKRVFEQFKSVGERSRIEAGVHVDFGPQITIGKGVYINAHCVLLDAAEIVIEDDVLIGPAVQIVTVDHPMDAKPRAEGQMQASPVIVRKDAWVGGGSIILPGITVGEGAIVGAGSVVTKDVEAGAVVKGNPAR